MSRGHGAVERAILSVTGDSDPTVASLYPLVFIAHVRGYNPMKLSVRQSFTRAGHRLAQRGLVRLYRVPVATAGSNIHGPTGYRKILCACNPSLEVNADKVRGAKSMAAVVYGSGDFQRIKFV